jgi:dTDP-4-amino-4,6-dideoxygalactose transaminase
MRVSEIQGAMINVQLEKLEFILEQLKKRKRQLDTHLKEIGFKLLPTYDNEGECHTTSRVLCDDATQNGKLVIELNKLMIKANSPMVRPAHQVWQWHHLLPKEKPQTKFDFLPSIDILSRILLIHVSLEGTDNEWIELIQKIRR